MAGPSTLDLYLNRIREIRALGVGTPETSYYPAVQAALDTAGSSLKPRVVCLHHPSGASGIPDYGLFLAPQKRTAPPPEWRTDTAPERGVAEVKGAAHSIEALIRSKQVQEKYLPRYQLVLVTNLWQFRLLRQGTGTIESFDLAPTEAEFWSLVHGPRPKPLHTRFADFLERCLLTNAPVTRPADLARFLASYARDALARLDEQATLPALASLRTGLQSALGVAFDAKDGEHLFRSTLVQTLFYGVFSAWVAHSRANTPEPFAWRTADWHMTVPVTRFLFRQVASPDALEPLHLVPLLDAATATLNRVDRTAFFANFADADAVQYFYEPFLEYFDPDLRKQLGVWYTPPEIVQYMVERVDRVLRSELNLPDGLADPNVWVLDPCCGTGSYLREVLNRIGRTLAEKGIGDLAAARLKEAATSRIVGFEIMTAPLVIAHWQVGETLRRAGAPLHQGERAAIYLTNALTGWDSAEQKGQIPGFDVLLAERTAANAVKQDRPILVVIGNPPYNAYAGTSQAGENDAEGNSLVAPYKEGLREKWGVKKYNLDDLFVRFFRIAERRIAARTGKGVVSYITNYSWLSLPSFTVMRQSLIRNFDRMWIENMHGDRTITEYGPDGRSSETVFAQPGFSPGIRQGVATALLVRTGEERESRYRIRDDIDQSSATERRFALLATLDEEDFESRYISLEPNEGNRFSLRYGSQEDYYNNWASIVELARTSPLPGLLEKRGGGLLSFDRAALQSKMKQYLDSTNFELARLANPALAADRARYDARGTWDVVRTREGYSENKIFDYLYFAFDKRNAYVSTLRPLWNEPRPQIIHVHPDAEGYFITRPQGVSDPEGYCSYFNTNFGDDYVLHKHAFFIPIIENLSGAPRPNLSDHTVAWLATVALPCDAASARLVWHHALATTYSPAYLADNAGGIRQGWPRIPLPDSADTLRASAALGAQLAALLDPDTAVPGVTAGTIRPELRAIAVPVLPPDTDADWSLSAWGNRTDKGITMPGRGHVTSRPYTPTESATAARADLLGATTTDIGLNPHAHWRNIPEKVWECRIGGYQVLKKWLSYRDASIIKRPLSPDEVSHITNTARRLAAILLLGPDLDASYRACAASHRPLPAAG